MSGQDKGSHGSENTESEGKASGSHKMTMSGVNTGGNGSGGFGGLGMMANGNSDPETHYDALGVPESASPDEIKQAYYRLVRQYRPTDYPDAFARFSEASRVLTDNRRRGEYDQNRRSGRRVQVLLDQAAVALDKDVQKAITLLKSAIALAPDMPRPRHLLAHVLMKAEDFTTAERQYRWLIREYPRDETIRYRLARCLQLQNRLPEAERELLQALRLNPAYFDAIVLLARIYETAGQTKAAIGMLERAIANDLRENYADFDAFQRLLVFYVQTDNPEEVARTSERLVAIVPNDDVRTDRSVRRLLQRAADFYERNEYPVARALADAAARISGATSEVHDEALTFLRRIELTKEATHACADPLFEGTLRECIYVKYLDRSSESARRQKMEALLHAFQRDIIEDPRVLGGAVEYLRREYPNVAADQNALMQELVTRVARRLEILGPSPKSVTREQTIMPQTLTQSTESTKEVGRKKLLGWLRRGGDTR